MSSLPMDAPSCRHRVDDGNFFASIFFGSFRLEIPRAPEESGREKPMERQKQRRREECEAETDGIDADISPRVELAVQYTVQQYTVVS